MKYPIGIQNFPSLIEDGYVYVDKTALVWQLANMGRYYFLSRPRRFGKSIFLSVTRQMLFLIPLLALLPQWWGLDGVWLSMPISDAISFCAASSMLVYMVRKIKKSEKNRTS